MEKREALVATLNAELPSVFAKLEGISIAEGKWSVNDVLFDVKFVDLLDVMDEDDVGKGAFVPIQNLWNE